MQLSPPLFDEVYQRFHDKWDLKKIRQMSISDYADMSTKNSLCYCLEYDTPELGEIGGMSLNKFELWQPKDKKDFKDGRFRHNDKYAWNARFGDDIQTAFEDIKSKVIEIVECAQDGMWELLDGIKFHAVAKWKLAFLFSDRRLFPVYTMQPLLAIARALGKTFTMKDDVWPIQEYIISQRPEAEDMVAFAHRTYSQFAEPAKNDKRQFFLIGSKYGEDDNIDMLPDFLKNECVATGFLDWEDFSEYMGAGNTDINEWVEEHHQAERPSMSKLTRIFRILSTIKEGDIIAVKSHGKFNRLTIVAYAQVVERKGSIYFHDEGELGHCINVVFLDAGFNYFTGLTYGETIHQLSPKKDGNKFDKIFRLFAKAGVTDEATEIYVNTETGKEEQSAPTHDTGYNEKSETPFERSAQASVVVNQLHNVIQNQFRRYLDKTYPGEAVAGEKRYVDMKRENGTDVFIYEIKPYSSVYFCIRSGIGQLLDYWHNMDTGKQKHIVIVGQGEPNERDMAFIDAIRNTISIPFSYISFNHQSHETHVY